MRVRILSRLPSHGYSGGRLHAICMAVAMARNGVDVDLVCDALPEMFVELSTYCKLQIRTHNLNDLSRLTDRSIDVVVAVPSKYDLLVHGEFIRHAMACRARTVMLNFESPNWFNSVCPFPRDVRSWEGWDIISEYTDMILSSAKESTRWALEYYTNAPKHCLFESCHPGINSLLADEVPQPKERKRQIVFLTSLSPHKGFDMLAALASEELRGYTIVMNFSQTQNNKSFLDEWMRRFNDVGIKLDLRSGISSREKFMLFKESALNFFPTRFEGFGLPPLEAAYCGCPSACSDLPVLREFGGEAFTYADPTDVDAMRRAILNALKGNVGLDREYKRLAEIADLDSYGRRCIEILGRLV